MDATVGGIDAFETVRDAYDFLDKVSVVDDFVGGVVGPQAVGELSRER